VPKTKPAKPKRAKPVVAAQPAPSIRNSFSDLDDLVLLTEAEAAKIILISPQAMKRWRIDKNYVGKGPTPRYINSRVRYRVSDLREWLANLSSSPAA
jgi:hypothetical protein